MSTRNQPGRLGPVAALLAALAVTACQKPSTGQGSEVDALVTSRSWPTALLRVCFDGPTQAPQLGDLAAYESAVAEAVQRNYRPETTGLSFTGFQRCDQGPADVKIIWNTDPQYPLFGLSSNLGTIDGRNYPSEGADQFFKGVSGPAVMLWSQAFAETQTKLSSNGASSVDAARFTALHELGHIAGMFHEHAALASTCHPSDESAAHRLEYYPDIAAQTYLDVGQGYDPYSIMSYCFGTQALGIRYFQPDPGIDVQRLPPPGRIDLSPTDQAGLRQLYGNVPLAPQVTDSFLPGSSAQAATPGLPAGACQITADTATRFCLACGSLGSTSSSCLEPLSRQIDTVRDCTFDDQSVTCSDGAGRLTVSYR